MEPFTDHECNRLFNLHIVHIFFILREVRSHLSSRSILDEQIVEYAANEEEQDEEEYGEAEQGEDGGGRVRFLRVKKMSLEIQDPDPAWGVMARGAQKWS